MQNKGAILTFAILFAIVSLYYLSFTWVTKSVENNALEYAQKFDKEAQEFSKGDFYKKIKFLDTKQQYYLDSVAGLPAYPLIGFTYRECKEKELNLGLDLRGGMNVTLEISLVDLVRSMANYSTDSTFVKTLALAQQKQKESQADFITLFGEAFNEVAPNGQLASIFNTRELKDRITYNTTNEEVLKILNEETQNAIDNSFNILRTRIDKFGVTQPNIQRLEGGTGRILVELPGVKDEVRVRKLLQGTANLEFWLTYSAPEIWQNVRAANDKLRDIENAKAILENANDTTLTEEVAENGDSTNLLNDLIGEESADNQTTEASASESSSSVTENAGLDSAKNTANTREEFTKENPLFGILIPVTDQSGNLQNSASVGYSHSKDTAKVNEYLSRREIKSLFPRDLKFLWEIKPWDAEGNFFNLVAIKTSRDGQPALGGDVITDATAEFGENQANSVVNMSMNGDGAAVWAKLTKQNIDKQIAIVLDNYVYSYPYVRSEITGGRSEISGNFTVNEAKDLANVLKSGKLPAPARIIEEAVVGPSLGQEAINSGLASFIIAFIIVLIYMIFYYNRSGLIADVALLTNIFLLFGVLASLGAVLTLPGIAGIVLTMGMAVDANVLIYERVKEELALGKGFRLAISDGYKNAYSAIIDGNVTTLLTAIILYIFGHGPVKGFAITLIIGITVSMFTAIFITRLIFIYFINRNKTVMLSTRISENAFKNIKFDFLGNRKKAYIISGSIILLGIISLFVRGLDQSVDFTGGRTYVVRFEQPVQTVDVAKSLEVVFGRAPEVKTFGSENQVKITTKYKIDDSNPEIDNEVEDKLYEGLKPLLGADVDKEKFLTENRQSSMKVGPTIADDIKIAAVWAILASFVVIFLYIFVRFKSWQYGLGGLVALVHDVLMVLSAFSLFYGILPFSLEIDQAFIAAVLTVVGYSINDTVIVFDRIREHLGLHKKDERAIVFNRALNNTLSRTFNTSFTTLIVLVAIFIFGGEVIRGFVFALLVGITVGTYSSLFIATPLAFDTIKDVKAEDTTKKK